jgi:hypothetical protein
MKTWLYIGAGVVLLWLLSRKSAAAGGGALDAPAIANTTMGGPNFGALDPSTWD